MMVGETYRSHTRQSRAGRFLLLSLMLHLLAVVALSLSLRASEELRPEQRERQNPIRVSFVRPENTEEPDKPEVFAETSSRAQTPEGPKADVAKDTHTAIPEPQQAPAQPSPPSKPQVREEPRPQVAPPPIPVTPKPAPEVAAKRPPSPSPPRQETAKATPQSPPKRERKPAEPPEPKRMARLPEPAEGPPSRPSQEPTSQTRPTMESPLQPEHRSLPRLGRIPLLSGEDLEKYAQVRTSDQQGASGGAVSLDSKELKYLSYFAHIKRRIERAWSYPPDAISNGLQGQLHLKFVLRSNGHVKAVELLRSSGYKVLDKEAWDAVVSAGPFEAFPPTIPDEELHITARFTYVLDEAAQRIRVR
jgi:periplasmic protein TonB